MGEKEYSLSTVVKRDGEEVAADVHSIEMAIANAASESGEILDAEVLADKAMSKFKGDSATVEEAQDQVVRTLMTSKFKKTAECYVAYRTERSARREEKSEWAKMGIDITTGSDSESQRENSNVPRGSVTTQVEMIKRLYTKKFALDFILPKRFKKAHESGDIHIHDCAELITKVPNCCLMHYPFMLENGFQLGNKWIEEPTTILTTMNILVQCVQVQSNLQFGGLTLQDLDVHLAKYITGSFHKHLIEEFEDHGEGNDLAHLKILIKEYGLSLVPDHNAFCLYKDEVAIALKRTRKEVYKACKLLGYQLNTLQIRGESSPFVTISYGSATDWAGRMLQEEILRERRDEFDRSGVQEFPKQMFVVRKGVNLEEGDPNFDIMQSAIETSAKTCYPDHIFPENQELHTGGSATYMG